MQDGPSLLQEATLGRVRQPGSEFETSSDTRVRRQKSSESSSDDLTPFVMEKRRHHTPARESPPGSKEATPSEAGTLSPRRNVSTHTPIQENSQTPPRRPSTERRSLIFENYGNWLASKIQSTPSKPRAGQGDAEQGYYITRGPSLLRPGGPRSNRGRMEIPHSAHFAISYCPTLGRAKEGVRAKPPINGPFQA